MKWNNMDRRTFVIAMICSLRKVYASAVDRRCSRISETEEFSDMRLLNPDFIEIWGYSPGYFLVKPPICPDRRR
jgi:hypothetical protein